MFSYGIALYCQMWDLAKTQIRIYRSPFRFLNGLLVWYLISPNYIPRTGVRDCRRMWQYKKTPRRMCCGVFGGSRGSRTPDPLLVRQTLWTNWAMLPNKLAPEPGLEPGTLWLTVRCSNQLSYSGILSLLFRNGIAKVQQFLFPANFFLHFFANFVKIF